MTVKQFFKSTAFKCIVVLLSVLLVCGVFLTVMYSFLRVTEGERLQRAVQAIYGDTDVKIYGVDGEGKPVEISTSDENPKGLIGGTVSMSEQSADILAAYRIIYDINGGEIGDGVDDVENILVQSVGKGGFSGGTVTCWISLVIEGGEFAGISKVNIASNVNQSFIGKITDGFLDGFTGDMPDGGFAIDGDNPHKVSGASKSSTAINHAVNGAVVWVRQFLGGSAQ